MIGVGFEGLPDEAALAAVERLFRERAAPLQAEVSTLADPALAALLSRRGYVLQGFENVSGRRIGAADATTPATSGFEIRPVEPEQLEAWADVSVTGFATPDAQGVPGEPLPPREALEGTIREFSEAPGFRRYAAWVGGRMGGAATLRLDAGLAILCGAS